MHREKLASRLRFLYCFLMVNGTIGFIGIAASDTLGRLKYGDTVNKFLIVILAIGIIWGLTEIVLSKKE